MKRLLAIGASGLTLGGCQNSYQMGFNALSDPGWPWGIFVAGVVTGIVLFALALFVWVGLRA